MSDDFQLSDEIKSIIGGNGMATLNAIIAESSDVRTALIEFVNKWKQGVILTYLEKEVGDYEQFDFTFSPESPAVQVLQALGYCSWDDYPERFKVTVQKLKRDAANYKNYPWEGVLEAGLRGNIREVTLENTKA